MNSFWHLEYPCAKNTRTHTQITHQCIGIFFHWIDGAKFSQKSEEKKTKINKLWQFYSAWWRLTFGMLNGVIWRQNSRQHNEIIVFSRSLLVASGASCDQPLNAFSFTFICHTFLLVRAGKWGIVFTFHFLSSIACIQHNTTEWNHANTMGMSCERAASLAIKQQKPLNLLANIAGKIKDTTHNKNRISTAIKKWHV